MMFLHKTDTIIVAIIYLVSETNLLKSGLIAIMHLSRQVDVCLLSIATPVALHDEYHHHQQHLQKLLLYPVTTDQSKMLLHYIGNAIIIVGPDLSLIHI